MRTPPRPASIPLESKLSGPATARSSAGRSRVTIPAAKDDRDPPFAIPVFPEEVPIDGPTGKYRLLVTFEKGLAAAGGETNST